MSDSASAMLLNGGSEAFETLGKAEKFFDSPNVTNFTSGHRSKRNFKCHTLKRIF